MNYLRNTLALLLFLAAGLFSGEGMWTFDNPPKKQLKEQFGFDITQDWLDHVRKASVRFNDGGSGSFVSPTGLVMTNHHVGLGQLQKMSKEGNDYVENGFYAKTYADEVQCVDLELNVLMAMQNVTADVLEAVKGKTGSDASAARRAALAQLQKETGEKTGLRADLVSLYNGAEYWIYSYKKFTDVRLVLAPEQQIAFFGGDPDNFTFPRYDLDMCFFRVYENGKPYNPQNYLKWKTAGAADGELVFTSGHPGSTARQQTVAQIEYLRDFQIPHQLKNYKRRLEALKLYSARGAEQERRALSLIFGLENSQKAVSGQYAGLLDKNLMAKKIAEEKELRDKVNADPELKKLYGWAWDSIAAATHRNMTRFNEITYRTLTGSIAPKALTIVQYAAEMKKPNGERMAQFQDANLKATLEKLYSPAPVYIDFEVVQLTDRFRDALEALGVNDPWVKAVLENRSPEDAAQLLISSTKLSDVAFRKALIEAGSDEIMKSPDPMIKMALRIAPIADELRQWQEQNVSSILGPSLEATGKARYAVYKNELPPDANFTLRLSYGQVKGFPMNGTIAPSMTTMYGLYDRAYSFQNKKDFELPKRFKEGVGKLNLATPMNFVSTHDIIGGNSGSPVVNTQAEVVGLIFDGNIESLPGRFAYSEEKNRAVSVHPGVMIETMRKLYDANILADELEGIVAKPEPPKESPVKKAKPAPKRKRK